MPNFSVGADREAADALEAAVGAHAALLDRHWDPVHARLVITMAATAPALRRALAAAVAEAVARIDLTTHRGAHPRVGAVDVCPIVYVDPTDRELAEALALEVAADLAGLGLPVFLYGALASAPERAERHHFRGGGPARLAERMRSGELAPDLGPAAPHPTAGAALVTARPPLAAFNLELEDIDLTGATEIAAAVRESGGGPAGVRAIAIDLGPGRVQVSTNVHDPTAVPLARVIDEVERHATAKGARVAAAELVGLVPEAALRGFPPELPTRGTDPSEAVIERRLAELDRR